MVFLKYICLGGLSFSILLVAPNYKMRRSVVDLAGSGRARDATGSSRFSRLPAHENLDRQSSHNTRTVKMWIPRLETFFFVVIYHFPYVEDSCLKGLFIYIIVYCYDSPLLHSLQILCRRCIDCIFILIYFA